MKNKSKARAIKIFLVITILISLIPISIYTNFFTIWWIKGDEPLKSVSSPDNRYTVTAYLNNGGATTAYAVLGTVKDNKTGINHNIYWQYRCDDAEIEWLDETTVVINGVELNVKEDIYDYRKNNMSEKS